MLEFSPDSPAVYGGGAERAIASEAEGGIASSPLHRFAVPLPRKRGRKENGAVNSTLKDYALGYR